MSGRLLRFALVAVVPTALDLGLLVLFRRGLGWILVLADLAAIGVATAVSYALHRVITFHSDPYVRWVRMPGAFAVVALLAAAVDVVVLRLVFAGTGFETLAGLVGAKVVALAAAAVVRLSAYRVVLLREVRRQVDEPGPPRARDGPFDVSVVLPALDEATGIGAAVEAHRRAALDAGLRVEVVVVDDGSTDGTDDAALAAGADQLIVQPVNRGKGAAVREGMLVARGRAVCFTDADLAYDPAEVLAAAARVDDGWDAVVGDRRHPDATGRVGSSRVRDLGSRVINMLTYAVLLGSYRDTQCGLKAFHRDAARAVFGKTRVDGFAFDVEVLHLIERYELSLLAIPATVRHSETSTVHLARDTWRLVVDLLRVRHHAATGGYEPDSGRPTPSH